MDKKKTIKGLDAEDIKGFEEFIEGQTSESHFLPRGVGGSNKKNETGFEHFTFLTNDSIRLTKLKSLLTEKLPFSSKFDQGDKLIRDQKMEVSVLRDKIFELSNRPDSKYHQSLREIFDSFFGPTE